MAGCELNVAHAFVGSPAAHRLRHDVIVTSADDFEAGRRRRRVENSEELDSSRGSMIPHYRLVPSGCGNGEWVTLSKSVLLQLVERICQLSFQTDTVPTTATTASAATTPSSTPVAEQTLPETSLNVEESTDGAESVMLTDRPVHLSPSRQSSSSVSGMAVDDAAATAPPTEVDESSTERADLTPAVDQERSDDNDKSGLVSVTMVASSDGNVVLDHELEVDAAAPTIKSDKDGGEYASRIITSSLSMPQGMSENGDTEDTVTVVEAIEQSVASPAVPVADAVLAVPAPPTVAQTPTPVRSTPSLRGDRRRRLRELRRLRRHHQSLASTGDERTMDRCRTRRRDVVARRRFAVPRQPPPPRVQDVVDRRLDGSHVEGKSSLLLPVNRRQGRICQPWSALNKGVVCQLVDVVLSEELTTTTTTWQSSTTQTEHRRASGSIWNPAVSPDTRESSSPTLPQIVKNLPLADAASSMLLHTLLAPMAAGATTYLDRRRSDSTAVDGDAGRTLGWTAQHSQSTLRRRHHSAAAPDSSAVPWTPSFFWYSVPPSQGNLFLFPDVASQPCYRWINVSSVTADACALDYRAQTLDYTGRGGDAGGEAMVGTREPAAAPPTARRRSSRPSTPPASVAGRSRRASGSLPRWVVVNKTDVSSLFESLASTMVTDWDERHSANEPTSVQAADSAPSGTEQGAGSVRMAAGSEPMKWKSTLLRRARAEALSPQQISSDYISDDVQHCSLDN